MTPLSFRAATCSGVFTLLPLLTGEGQAHHGKILHEATRLSEAGRLAPKVDPRRFTLETVGGAYAALVGRRTDGRLAEARQHSAACDVALCRLRKRSQSPSASHAVPRNS